MRSPTLWLCCLVLVIASHVNAVTIYAPNGLPRPYPFDGPDTLIRFDSSNPAGFTTVGSMNVPNIGFGGMDFDRDGNLWAYASFFKSTGGAAGGLYKVDINTGAATPVGNATQSLEDMAFDPADNTMYGIHTQNNVTRLYTINLTSGAVASVGILGGLPASQHTMGLAIDSTGNFYVHDLNVDKIFKGSSTTVSELYALSQDTNFSQGMTIDWSRGDVGYQAAVGYGVYPNYFSELNTFAVDGSNYTLGAEFGPDDLINGVGYPQAEPGDLAIAPVPEPASATMLLAGVMGMVSLSGRTGRGTRAPRRAGDLRLASM
jgi:hypothetical protein